MPTNIEAIEQAGIKFIRQTRDPNKTYEGHEESHLLSVARLSELAGLAAEFTPRQTELAFTAGLMHDLYRSPSESNGSTDEELSAKGAVRFMSMLNQDGTYPNNHFEQGAVAIAINRAGRTPDFFTTLPIDQLDLTNRTYAALFVGDKLEANGLWVIARRSAFVAGARLKRPDGDLKVKWGLEPEKDEVKAVLLESALRLAFINPENNYPPVFREIVSPLYDQQRPFVLGLLAESGMDVAAYAQMLLDTRRVDDSTKNYISDRKGLPVPKDAQELAQRLKTVGGITDDQIFWANGNLTDAATEAVAYFSHKDNYQRELIELVQEWQPYGLAEEWRKGMLEYANGTWYRQTRAHILASHE